MSWRGVIAGGAWLLLGFVAAGAEGDPLRPPAVEVEGVPVVPAELAERLRQYQAVRQAEFRGWAPDGKGILIRTRFGETMQLHRVYEPGGRREQVTFFSEPVDGRFVPEDEGGDLLVTMSRGGNENDQIYRYDRETGRATLLTDGESRNTLGPVSEDGAVMLVASNKRNGRDTDLYVADPGKPGSMRMVLETEGEFWEAEDLSRDGTQALINHYVSINETYPAVLDLKSGEKRLIDSPLPGHAGPVAYANLAFGPDAKSAYVSTDLEREFQTLARVDLRSKERGPEMTRLTGDIPWDVSEVEVDPETGRVAFVVNEGGTSGLYLLEAAAPGGAVAGGGSGGKGAPRATPPNPPLPRGGAKTRRVEVPQGVIESLEFSEDGERLGFTLARAEAPSDAYSVEVATGELTRWTYSEVGGLNPEGFVAPEKIAFESFDGREIPAFYYRPRGASKEQPAAVLISIHGGPESQYRPNFSGFDQFLVNELNIAVIAPNVRGSAGYGKSYLLLDNAEKREDSVRDVGALLDWIAERPELDEGRVAVMGGSYGGYMVLGSLTNYPERIRAGIDIVGIASFITFLENTSPYRQDLRRAEYGDERDAEMRKVFERINPTSNVEKIRSALLVAHGKNDPRVPFSEAQQIAEKVRGRGGDVWTLYAENEGHGFAKKPNRDYLTAVVAMFLRDHLLDK